MPPPDGSLWDLIARGGRLSERFLYGVDRRVALAELAGGSSLDGAAAELVGRAVLIAAADQLAAALALIELDGIARRVVLATPDLPPEYLAPIVAAAEIEAIVHDDAAAPSGLPAGIRAVACRPAIAGPARAPLQRSEWVLLTSGTTGVPKLVVHTLASLTGPIKPNLAEAGAGGVWSTFYDIRRYGGLQIFLRAILGGASLVLSSAPEKTADFLARAGHHGITHISGTPSHWRRALMSGATGRIAPRYVRLSGEIADQAILDDLKAAFRGAGVAHAFATTEAGVGFSVEDGLAGFPANLVGRPGAEVEIAVVDESLRIRSARTATRYLGATAPPLRDAQGFVDTGDILERRGERYHFVGRRGGIVNVGGLKVHPEEVEAVLNRHPAVQMSLVTARRNPFTGAVVVAEIVVRPGIDHDASRLQGDILAACRRDLPPYKVPAAIRFVDALNVGTAGKLARHGA